MNHPYIQELLANQRLNDLRVEGMRSQELKRAGIKGNQILSFDWAPVFHFVSSRMSQVRLTAVKEIWAKVFRTGKAVPASHPG